MILNQLALGHFMKLLFLATSVRVISEISIMRTNDVYLLEVDEIIFNQCPFTQILIPLSHINFDQGNSKRSEFSIEQVAEIVCQVLDGLELVPDGVKKEKEYFVYFFSFSEKSFKLVFATHSHGIEIEVLTLHRQRRL